MPSDSPIHVVHNTAERRFEATVDGKLAEADYALEGGRMIMTHTFVPPELRGRGLAEKVVRAALDHARTNGLKVTPACSYVDTFIQRNREYQALVG